MRKNTKVRTEGTASIIGRFAPLTMAHLNIFFWMLTRFDRIVICIGSCYEYGSERFPFLALFREKIILYSLMLVGVDMNRVVILHVPDYGDFESWWATMSEIFKKYEVSLFACGNEKQVLREINERGIVVPFEIFNPETDLPERYRFPYHATDLRNALMGGNYDLVKLIAAPGVMPFLSLFGGLSGIKELKDNLNNNGTKFIEGRQTVDMIITAYAEKQRYVLSGYRDKKKENFPGFLALPGGEIKLFESPMDAAIRECEEETGLTIKMLARHLEPAHVSVNGRIVDMRFVKLFSTTDPKKGGNQGGSSQVFHIDLEVDPKYLKPFLKSRSDLKHVSFREINSVLKKGLAYQQSEMLRAALNM